MESEEGVAVPSLQDRLADVARKLTMSSGVYSDALSKLARQTASLGSVSHVLTRQLDFERGLFGSASELLRQMSQVSTISPSMQALVSANANLTRIIAAIAVPETALSAVFANQPRIPEMVKGIGLTDSLTVAFARMDSTRMLSVSLAAQLKLARLDGLSLGCLVGFDQTFRRSTAAHLGSLTRSYRSLMDFAATSKTLTPHLPLIMSYPPVEYYRQVGVLESVTVDETSRQDDAIATGAGIAAALPHVDDLLRRFDESLCALLVGARQSLRGNNPDRTRHVTASLRELLTHVLHALAPDDGVIAWAPSGQLIRNKRPTRRARLLYICRGIDCGPLTRFVEDDVGATLSFFDTLSSGTHAVESQFTPAQLASLVSRMESLLVFQRQQGNH